jgi:hypothetical protein
LKTTIRWASSTVMMASIAEAMIPVSRASLRRRASSAIARSLTSRMIPVKKRPPGSCVSLTANSSGNSLPSLRLPRTSRPIPMIRRSCVRRYRSR